MPQANPNLFLPAELDANVPLWIRGRLSQPTVPCPRHVGRTPRVFDSNHTKNCGIWLKEGHERQGPDRVSPIIFALMHRRAGCEAFPEDSLAAGRTLAFLSCGFKRGSHKPLVRVSRRHSGRKGGPSCALIRIRSGRLDGVSSAGRNDRRRGTVVVSEATLSRRRAVGQWQSVRRFRMGMTGPSGNALRSSVLIRS